MLRVVTIAAALLVGQPAQEGAGYAAEPVRTIQSEYQVKAAFVYNFIKFVEWPVESAFTNSELHLCLMGDMADLGPLVDLQGQALMGKRLTVKPVRDQGLVGDCQVLFIASSLAPRMKEILQSIAGKPILTIGDTEGFARQGIMINMYLERKRVRFEVNARSARDSGLQISTKLLNLAGIVYDGAEGER